MTVYSQFAPFCLKLLLLRRLEWAVCQVKGQCPQTEPDLTIASKWIYSSLSLNSLRISAATPPEPPGIYYSTAIALSLATQLQQSPGAVSQTLVGALEQGPDPPRAIGDVAHHLWAQIQTELQASGWIYFRLPMSALTNWLSTIQSDPARAIAADPDRPGWIGLAPAAVWPLQYCHARCWSVLQGGLAAGCLPAEPDPVSVASAPVEPWRIDLTSRSLLEHSLRFLDRSCEQPAPPLSTLVTAGLALSQAWEDWYRAHPPVSLWRSPIPQVTLQGWLLTRSVQQLLQVFLEEDLGTRAPLEL